MSIKPGYRKPVDLFKYDKRRKKEHRDALIFWASGVLFLIIWAITELSKK